MIERARGFLRKAEDCERQAALATDERTRHTFERLARDWRRMAEQADALERRLAGERGGKARG
jgi:hypothetical protein